MIKVIICAFGVEEKRLELIRVCLYSLFKNTPFNVEVFHDNIPARIQREINSKLSNVKFNDYRVAINPSFEIASQKIYMWYKILVNQENGSKIILSDLDTLYLKDISDAFDTEFDIAYTAKDDESLKYPINTGIVFFRINEKSKFFLKKWMEETDKILKDKNRSKEAIETFGGADQKSLSNVLEKSKGFFGPSEVYGVKLFGFKASLYNLHKDWSNPCKDTGMIHFKSSWKNILVNDHEKLEDVMKDYREDIRDIFMGWEKSFLLWRQYQSEYYSL